MTPALKRFFVAAAAIVATAVLIACPTNTPPGSEVVLTYTFVSGDPTREVLDALGNEAGLAGIEVRPLTVPPEVLLREPYVLSLSTGSPAIDAYLLDAPWVKSYSGARWLAPMAGGEAEGFEIDLSAFRDELLEVTSLKVDDEQVVLAVPFHTKGNILFYRRDLLEAAGFQPPRTWAELFSQCEAILAQQRAAAGEAEQALRWGFLFHGKLFINDFYPIMWGFGGGIFDESGRLTVNRPENVRALATIKTMLGRISPSAQQMEVYDLFEDYQAPDRLFAAGAAIFMVNWNTRLRDLEAGLPGQRIDFSQVGVAPLPVEDEGPHYSNIGSFCWGINYYSRHRESAARFIRAVTSYEAQRWAALHRGELPSRLDVLEDPEVVEKAPSIVTLARVFERVQLRARPYQREINEILDAALMAAIRNGYDPLQALDFAQEEIDRELARIR